MSTSSPVGGSWDEDDDFRRAMAESLLSASRMIPLGPFGVNEVEDEVDEFTRLSLVSRSELSASTAHHVGDAGDDDINLHQSTISMTSVEESEESREKIFAERLSAWEDFMKKVRVCDRNARTSFENFNSESFNIEATETQWPTQGSELLSQTLVRIGELQEMKQTLQGDNAALASAFHAR